MKKILAGTGVVLAVVGAVAAPQAHWLLLSPDRVAMSAVEVETAADQHYTQARAQHLDRIECEPIAAAPGTSRCEAQEEGEVFGLVLELGDDGASALHAAQAAELPVWSDG